MPYSGEQTDRQTEWAYFQRLPGLLVAMQTGCSFVGFALSVLGSFLWRVTGGHGAFIFLSFLSCGSCCVMVGLRVFHMHTAFCPHLHIDWNKLGMGYSGINSLIMMIASCVMIEVASAARMLRAAGVFGFLAFSAFLGQLAWEVVTWKKERDLHSQGFHSASVVKGRERPASCGSGSSDGGREGVVSGAVAMEEEEDQHNTVGFVAMKKRPVSSFLPANDVTTPMLFAPGWREDEAMEKGEKNRMEESREEGRKGEKKGEGGEKSGENTGNKVSNRSSSSSSSACDWQVPS